MDTARGASHRFIRWSHRRLADYPTARGGNAASIPTPCRRHSFLIHWVVVLGETRSSLGQSAIYRSDIPRNRNHSSFYTGLARTLRFGCHRRHRWVVGRCLCVDFCLLHPHRVRPRTTQSCRVHSLYSGGPPRLYLVQHTARALLHERYRHDGTDAYPCEHRVHYLPTPLL